MPTVYDFYTNCTDDMLYELQLMPREDFKEFLNDLIRYAYSDGQHFHEDRINYPTLYHNE